MKFGKKKIFYLVVGAVIVTFILGGVYYYFGSKKSIISEGDTLDYQVDVTVAGYGTISGGITYEVIDVSEDRIIISITPTGELSNLWDESVERVEREEPTTYSEIKEKGEFLGAEAISTQMGVFEVDHYRYENQITYQSETGFVQGLENTDVYVENNTGMTVKMKVSSPEGYSVEMVISDTTIKHLQNQAM